MVMADGSDAPLPAWASRKANMDTISEAGWDGMGVRSVNGVEVVRKTYFT